VTGGFYWSLEVCQGVETKLCYAELASRVLLLGKQESGRTSGWRIAKKKV